MKRLYKSFWLIAIRLAASSIALAIPVSAQAQQWHAQYFEKGSQDQVLWNQPLTGLFPISAFENLNLNWGEGGPNDIGRDNHFAALFKRPIAPGSYTVHIKGDDGIRGKLEIPGGSQPYFIDIWRRNSSNEQWATVHVSQPNTWLAVEYFEADGQANLLVELNPISGGGGSGCAVDQFWTLDHYNGSYPNQLSHAFSNSVCGDTLFHEDFAHPQGRFIRATNHLQRRGYYRVHMKADDWAFVYDGKENLDGEVDVSIKASESVMKEHGPYHTWQHKTVFEHCFGDNGEAKAIIIYQDDASHNAANRAFLQAYFERIGDC